jgi:hypothetical protein
VPPTRAWPSAPSQPCPINTLFPPPPATNLPLPRHNQQDNGWHSCLTISAGFQAAPAAPSELHFAVAVFSHLPIALPLAGAALQLRDEKGSFTVAAAQGPPPPAPPPPPQQQQQQQGAQQQQGDGAPQLSDALSRLQLGAAAAVAQQQQPAKPLANATLAPGGWHRFHFSFAPRCVGPLAAEQLTLALSPNASVAVSLLTFPPRQQTLSGAPWPHGGGAPFGAAAGVRLGVFGAPVAHVGPLPVLQVGAASAAAARRGAPGAAATPVLYRERSPASPAAPVTWDDHPLLPSPRAHPQVSVPHAVQLVGEHAPVDVTFTVTQALGPTTLELGVRIPSPPPVGGSAAAESTDDGGGSGGGAAPAVALLAEQGGQLQELPLAGATLRLPPVPAGGCHTQRLWLRASAPLGAALTATLLCPAPVAAGAALEFRQPFESAARLFSETNVHTLVAPSGAYEAAATAAAAPGGAPAAPAVPLVIGQASMAQVLVRGAQGVPLELLGASLADPAAGLQLVNRLADQLPAGPSPVGPGSGHVLLLHLLATQLLPPPGAPLGRLLLRWRRADAGSGDDTGDEARDTGAGKQRTQLDRAAAAPAEVETSLELPRVTVADAVLSARVVAPPAVTAGIAFPFQLQVPSGGARGGVGWEGPAVMP